MSVSTSERCPFRAEDLTPRIVRIEDERGVLMYLLKGDERALLVDSGFGVGDLPAFVAQLTSLPVAVLLTHGHVDHAFGAGWFATAYLHPADLPVLEAHRPLAADVAADAAREGAVLAPAVDPTSLRPLADGQRFGLGGLDVEVHEVPGHTPGSVARLLEQERILLTGDAANQFTFLFHPEASSVAEYSRALRRLRGRVSGRYDRVLVSHGDGEVPVTLLTDLIGLCATVSARADDAVPFEFMGTHGLVARAVGGQAVPDGEANLVYDPARLGPL